MRRFLAPVVLVLAALLWIAGPVLPLKPSALHAQEAASPEFAQWLSTVDRAEDTIARGQASDAAFETLRRELVDWRSQFEEGRRVNNTRIRTVQAEIEALGPPPAEGATEAPAVAQLRTTLNERLEELLAPVLEAEVAYNRADALVGEIDQILRQRQATELLEREVSPAWPASWRTAWRDVSRAVASLGNEVRAVLTSPAQRARFDERVPVAIGLLLLGAFLILVVRRLAERLSVWLSTRTAGPAAQLAGLLISLFQIVVPLLGLVALLVAGQLTYATGFLSQAVLTAFLKAAFLVVFARWLATRLFPLDDRMHQLLALSPADRAKGRRYATLLGLVLALHGVVVDVSTAAGFPTATQGVLDAPLIVAAAFLFWRSGALIRRAVPKPAETVEPAGAEAGDASFVASLLWVLSQILNGAALVGLAASAMGYTALANFAIFPMIGSLGLISLLVILQTAFRNLFAFLTGAGEDEARAALLPVLATFASGIALVPLLALVWGARWTDIADAWEFMRDGVQVGGSRIGLSSVLTILVVFALGFAITRLLQSTLKSTVLPRTKLDAGGRNAITAGLGYVGLTLAAIAAITAAGVDLTGFALVASALSIGIGFGLRTIVENFVSGVIMLIERPVSEGDWIEVGGQMGIVKDISVRSTRIQTFDRTDVIVPNSDFVSGMVTNWTRGNTVGRVIVPVGVGYDADSRKVEELLMEICEAHPLVALDPPPRVIFRAFGDSSLQFECYCILRDVNFKLQVQSDINHEILARFRAEGIAIPFPQRDLWLRNPETLPGAASAPKPAARARAARPATPEGETA
jgi:small-conductance mechanosensitive channel